MPFGGQAERQLQGSRETRSSFHLYPSLRRVLKDSRFFWFSSVSGATPPSKSLLSLEEALGGSLFFFRFQSFLRKIVLGQGKHLSLFKEGVVCEYVRRISWPRRIGSATLTIVSQFHH
jgi:hypothetical protein